MLLWWLNFCLGLATVTMAMSPWHSAEKPEPRGVNCDFNDDNMCGYTLDNQNGLRWSAGQGFMYASPRENSMNGSPFRGRYLYIGPNNVYRGFAYLLSPKFTLQTGQKMCLYFFYHNQVSGTCRGDSPFKQVLQVFLRNENDKDTLLRNVTCVANMTWFTATVPIAGEAGEYQLVFAGAHHRIGYLGIDDVRLHPGECMRRVPSHLRMAGDCEFEDKDLCCYTYLPESNTTFVQEWPRSVRPSITLNKTPPVGQFLFMNYRFFMESRNGTARLQSPAITLQKPGCLSLFFYNDVPAPVERNVLNIYKKSSGREETFLTHLPKSFGLEWINHLTDLDEGKFNLIIEGIVERRYYGVRDYIGLDSVELFSKPCSEVRSSTNDVCDDEDICHKHGMCLPHAHKAFSCSCSEGYYGDRCQHALPCSDALCQNHGQCENRGRNTFHCSCRLGTYGDRCENVVTCGTFDAEAVNGIVTNLTNTSYGGLLTMTCKEGYTTRSLENQVDLRCFVSGTWMPNNTQCILKQCEPPSNASHVVFIDVTSHEFGGTAQYTCAPGYRTVTGADREQAECDRFQWNATCRRIADCGRPPVQQHAHIHHQNGTVESSIVVYKCDDDSAPKDKEIIYQCSYRAWWRRMSGAFGCVVIPQCETPPRIDYAHVTNDTISDLNRIVKYKCDSGAMLYPVSHEDREGIMKCVRSTYYQHIGRWIVYLPIECMAIPSCGNFTNIPPNSHVTDMTNSSLFGEVTVTCNKDSVPKISNSSAMMEFKCTWIRPGERYVEWKAESRQICLQVSGCGEPPSVDNGHVIEVTDVSLNGEAEYACDKGFRIQGSSTAICWKTGTQDYPVPRITTAWIFAPRCMQECPVPSGAYGSVHMVNVEVVECVSEEFAAYGMKDACSNVTTQYTIQKGTKSSTDNIVFYGKDVCIAQETTETLMLKKIYGFEVIESKVGCAQFCMDAVSDFKRLLVSTEMQYDGGTTSVTKTYRLYKTLPF